MITREEIREISEIYSPEGCALTFYYQPVAPADKSRRHEAILVKDLVRETLAQAEQHGKNSFIRPDLERILAMADQLQGNSRQAKAIFACSHRGIWREFDLPPVLVKTQLAVNSRFHLKPLAPVLDANPRVLVALIDRNKARIFETANERITELEDFVKLEEAPRKGRSDGFAGYDAGHAERHESNESMRHFKTIGDFLQAYGQTAGIDRVAIGCRDDVWSEIKPNLHKTTLDHLIGQFRVDPKTASPNEVKERVDLLLAEQDGRRKLDLLREVIGEASRNGRGALGLRRVLRSLEMGEVQALLLEDKFDAPGVQCTNCNHIDINMSHSCSVCGQPTIGIEDIADPLLARAMAAGVELHYVPSNPDLDRVGRIAALLRFRADQNTPMKLAI
jgi:peptide subunit release factor 1 (eRF1)